MGKAHLVHDSPFCGFSEELGISVVTETHLVDDLSLTTGTTDDVRQTRLIVPVLRCGQFKILPVQNGDVIVTKLT